MTDPRLLDPHEEIVQHRGLTETELNQTVQVLESLRRWHSAERSMSEAARKHMDLGETDMRALRYLIAAQANKQLATPSELAQHLGISTAAVTKLLDRLSSRDHIRRLPHPQDRRSTAIQVTDETRQTARSVVGRTHAGRFHAAAALSSDERATVIRFLDALSATVESE
ncbi:MarR family winged helix-turn-helix transcriptional regulator [Nesterenkonia sphaerica]|uniref:MarR family transcriptional regulator n=1 Tax=Nesterenkonia sphaerica TaxID=1804988 RepID=A0A5R9A5T5_9MICC|nr:MarR family transcriptional regulator [Nesterenkonia sphaerica]TLP74069.1 MarR family transcriptional regulator [Nesterenkonia sphaerica]